MVSNLPTHFNTVIAVASPIPCLRVLSRFHVNSYLGDSEILRYQGYSFLERLVESCKMLHF